MTNTALLCLFITIWQMAAASDYKHSANDLTLHHECLRTCEWPPQPRTCVYNFTVDWFLSMSVACNDCPINRTHCNNQYCIPLNGVARPIAVVNKLLPGPAIQACEGDTIIVNVTNHLDDAEGLTIHWHGVHQRGTQYMDGVPMVTQCPIHSYTSFTYRFKAEPHGTHWWHSHSGSQRADGVFGAMIFRQALQADVNSALYDFDLPEHVIAVHDWFDVMTHTKYITHIYGGGDHVPDSILINGKGKRRGFLNDENKTVYTEREMYKVTPGMRYRFRVLSNAITVCPIKVSIDSHKLIVIASDGASLQPYEADSLVIHSGERYDFVLNTNQETSKYWMRFEGLTDCSGLEELALIEYEGVPIDDLPEEVVSPAQDKREIVVNPWGLMDSEEAVPIVTMKSADADRKSAPSTPRADVVFYLDMGFNKVNKYFKYTGTGSHHGHMDKHENMERTHEHTPNNDHMDADDSKGGQMDHSMNHGHMDKHKDIESIHEHKQNHDHQDAGHVHDDSKGDQMGHSTGHVHDDSKGDQTGHSMHHAHAMHYLYTAQVNHMSFKMTSKPLLTDSCRMSKDDFCWIAANSTNTYPKHCEDEYCSCTQGINVTLGQVVDLVLVDEGRSFEMAHPMHLHGYSFQVIAQGTLGTQNTIEEVMRQDRAGNITRKLEKAPFKDTIIVQNGGYTIVRFVANNPGWWFFHCHAQFHVQAGMSLVVHVGTDADLPPKPINFPSCGSWPSSENNSCSYGKTDIERTNDERQRKKQRR